MAIHCALAGMLAVVANRPLSGQAICATSTGTACGEVVSSLQVNGTLQVTASAPDILFTDTSPLPGGNDWLIKINEGVEAFFAISDATNGGRIFQIDQAAQPNSIHIAQGGKVGLGTATPAKPVHIASSSPAVRFDDIDAPSQVWDLFGNGQEFGVVDATSGRTPFRLQNGAPDNSLRIASNGNVGLGTLNPARPLHIASDSPGIRFEDTDDPTQSWNLFGNNLDFGVFNVTSATTPFSIYKYAPDNSLRIVSSGYIGFGTSRPLQPVHVLASAAVIRLESLAGSAKAWDIFGADEFAIHEAGSIVVPFRIRAGAGHDSIHIASSGDIGFGTGSPLAGTGIHVRKSGFVIPTFESSDGNAVQFRLRSDSPNNRRVVGITNAGVVKSQLRLDDGAVVLQGQTDANRFALFNASGLVIEGGTCLKSAGGMACDAVFDPGYGLESIEEHAAAMWDQGHLPAVGPTPEGKPVSFNVVQRHFGILNELEKAHIYIERLNEENKRQKASIAELERRVAGMAALEKRLRRMESLLAARAGAED